eukprot:TRINITY_DN31076_c0_g2_i1.p1 TRINITY_DN31076_c0_g2~~TRINITY_DN31076_c0_g2_i1.p1  ORF type:complete len:678 (-),score=95.10 TRINITY_DN31076_c0_g2_i1:58-1827(-)
MPIPAFVPLAIMNGGTKVGTAKLCVKVVHPIVREWYKHKQYKGQASELFDPAKFRRKYKLEIPQSLRIRSYIIRGLKVSGADGGHGNPYLFFMYGNQRVLLEGKRQMGVVEPRFFHTEERDIVLPDQSYFEVGLYDWSEGGGDRLIGSSVIDLEDRWYTEVYQKYMQMNKVPLEYRPLETGGSGSLSKGSLEMWMEIVDSTHAAEVPVSPLFQPPPVEVEVRAVVFKINNISRRLCVDDLGDQREQVDVICRCAIDSRAFRGTQNVTQETDKHFGCQGDAEYNWRFVWSRLQVTKGVPLDCFLQLSLWEVFTLGRPMLLCEALIEMKNYCKKVANNGNMIQIEADIPLTNSKLTQLLRKDLENETGYAEDDQGPEEDGGDDDDFGGGDEALVNSQSQKKSIPPAAVAQVMVQVFSQTEASSGAKKVGLGRNEPNRDPMLPFPKTGRDWKATLPTAAKIVDAIDEAMATGKSRCKLLMGLLLIIGVFVLIMMIPNPKHPGCNLLQNSCKETCGNCQTCAAQYVGQKKISDADYCYYMFVAGYPANCVSSPKTREKCNVKQDPTNTFTCANAANLGVSELCLVWRNVMPSP